VNRAPCPRCVARWVLPALLIGALGGPVVAQGLPEERARMLRDVEAMAADAAPWTDRARLSAPVLRAMGRVPRHEFVPPPLRAEAWRNYPLPIGAGQTISQPYIVALMSDLLAVAAGARVLEVGTGSGYQAAVLAEMGLTVYSVEIIESLAREAAARLERLGYAGVRVRAGDGYHGWPQHAPFDGIIVTAAAPHVPQPLVDQLAAGGRLVIPVGPEGGTQHLLVIEKRQGGEIDTRQVLPVRFVPLTGQH